MNAADKAPLDWLHWMIGMYSFRSFAREKPTWMLSYSWDREKDVSPGENMQNLFASQLAAGTNCWDARGHVMSGSNYMAMRTEIFGWIARHEQLFYNARTTIHPLGIYFSPHTRDYFCEEFLDSYLGLMALVMHGHGEFEIVTPRTLAAFHGEILALPDARCLGEQELAQLETYARSGGKLMVTGQSGEYDETGKPHGLNPLHQFLGIRNPAEHAMGAVGLKYAYLPGCPGKAYWQALSKDYNQAGARGVATGRTSESLLHDFDTSVLQPLGFDAPVQVEASPFVTAQIRRSLAWMARSTYFYSISQVLWRSRLQSRFRLERLQSPSLQAREAGCSCCPTSERSASFLPNARASGSTPSFPKLKKARRCGSSERKGGWPKEGRNNRESIIE